MILLDTHVWIWWVHGEVKLPEPYRDYIDAHQADEIGVSVISCWEVAKLVELERLKLSCPVADWLRQAASYPGIRMIDLTPQIAVESTQLPGSFHRDPADQIIVATARVTDSPLVTLDGRILSYPHVKLQPASGYGREIGIGFVFETRFLFLKIGDFVFAFFHVRMRAPNRL